MNSIRFSGQSFYIRLIIRYAGNDYCCGHVYMKKMYYYLIYNKIVRNIITVLRIL